MLSATLITTYLYCDDPSFLTAIIFELVTQTAKSEQAVAPGMVHLLNVGPVGDFVNTIVSKLECIQMNTITE